MTTYVWYVGPGRSYTITGPMWAEKGIADVGDVSWNEGNSWSIDQSRLTTPQLNLLAGMTDFSLGHSDLQPRPVRPAAPATEAAYNKVARNYYEKTKAAADTVVSMAPIVDTAANLAASNPIPAVARRVRETDTGREKTGDGTTHYNDLPYDPSYRKVIAGIGPVGRITGFGHSYMAWPNIALDDQSDTYMARVAKELGVVNDNRAVPGASLMSAENTGGWKHVFTELPRTSGREQIVLFHYGLNDIAAAGLLGAPFEEAFQSALTAVVSRVRAAPGSIKAANDASIAWSAGWTYDSGAIFGVPVKYSFTSGNTYTITTPANFPGGTVCIDLLTAVDDGAVHTFTLDGVAVGSIDTKGNSGGVQITPSVFRIPGVDMGSHTIVGTISGLTASVTRTEVLGWHYEDAPSPLVVLIKQPKAIKYTAYSNPGRPTDAAVDSINSIIDTVAASFGANVVTVDLDGAFTKQQALFMYYDGLTSDWIHPGPLGHEVIAESILAKLRWVIV